MKTKLIIIFLFLFFLSNASAIQVDLKKCLELAIKNNPKIKASLYAELSKKESVKSALMNLLLPDIYISRSRNEIISVGSSGAVDVEYLDQITDMISFNISKNVLSLISDLPVYHRANLEKKIAELQKKSTILDLTRKVSVTFYNILKIKQDIKSLNEAITYLKVNLDFAKALFEKRLIPYTNVLDAKVDLEDVRQRLSVEKNKERYYKNYLKTLIGIPSEEKIELRYEENINPEIIPQSLEECINHAFKHRPELAILRFRKKIYENEKKLWFRRMVIPRLDVGIAYNEYNRDYKEPGRSFFGYYDRDFEISYWNTFISMRWELSSVPKNLVEIKRTKFDIKSIEEQIKDTKNTIKNQVRNYYYSVHEALGRISTTKIALKAAKEAYQQAEEKFRLMLGSISEVLDARERLTKAESNYHQALLDFQVSLANLRYAMGMNQ